MFISEAFAQTAAPSPFGGDIFGMIMPLAAIMAVFYFLMIRPQQRKIKEHQEMLSKVTRGDTVVTTGGLIGRVKKVLDDNTIQVEVGENVVVNVVKGGISEIRAKGEPKK